MEYYDKIDVPEKGAGKFDGIELEELLYEFFEYKRKMRGDAKSGANKPYEAEMPLKAQDAAEEVKGGYNYYGMPYETGEEISAAKPAERPAEAEPARETTVVRNAETVVRTRHEASYDALYDAEYESQHEAEEADWMAERNNRPAAGGAPCEKGKKPESEFYSDVIKMLMPLCAKVIDGHRHEGRMDKHTIAHIVEKVIHEACQFDDIEDITLETDREYLSRYKLLWALCECMVMIENLKK